MSRVVIKECLDYGIENLTRQLNEGIELIGGWNTFVSSGTKVLLKVNLIGPKTPESSAVTHCEFVRALVRILQARGCEVWIGDSAGGAIAGVAPTARSFEVSGLKRVAEEEGAILKNFEREGVVEKTLPNGYLKSLHLAKPVFDADVVINLPKLKTHMSARYTGAVKNLFGLIAGLKKAEYHKIAPDPKNFGQIIADINEASTIGLHIMDGISAMEGEGPTAGRPYPAGKILMSTDPLALDVVAAKMVGLEVNDIPILEAARERGLGEWDLQKVDLCGDYEEVPILKGFRLPRRIGSNRKFSHKLVVKVIDFLKTRPRIDPKVCKHCNMCVESCPVDAIDRETKIINYEQCIECMCCHELCQHKAVALKKDNPVAALLTRSFGARSR